MKKRFVRRSLLYVPGSSEKKMEKALQIDADGIIFDLEDAVSISEKDAAREMVAAMLPKVEHQEKIVRINAMDTFWGIEDLKMILKAQPDTIILPKANVDHVKMADQIMTVLEEHYGLPIGGIGLIPLLETTDGILNARAIIGAAARVNGVQLGAEDLTKELSVARTREGGEIGFARSMMACAGCAEKVDIIDTPFTGIHDLEGLEADTEKAKTFGITGKTCIYPTHVEVINRLFSPTTEAVDHARRLLAAFDEAIAEGKGACMFEKKMIDQPVADRARKLIEKYEFIMKQSKRGI
ncbi:HpcH/HpaI aldolase/citrate lyase family protein [Anaerotignum sp.]